MTKNQFSDTLASNLLPGDGTLFYYPELIGQEDCERYMGMLLENIPWQQDRVKIFGKTILTRRETAWFGDHAFEYKYSGVSKLALPWTPLLLELKQITERYSGVKFNSCLLNHYHDGSEAMGWHSDDEKMLGSDPIIAAMSFGAQRTLRFRHKSRAYEPFGISLQPGSLLVMGHATQRNWQHSITQSKKIALPRISLTFRTILPSDRS